MCENLQLCKTAGVLILPKNAEKVIQSAGSKSGHSADVAPGWSHEDWLRVGYHRCPSGKSKGV